MTDVFRKVYTSLTDEQKKKVDETKDKAVELLKTMTEGMVEGERSEKARCINIARTKLEETVMWAVKGITTQL